MAKHILNANNLTKRYGHKVAVSNVSLTVQSNEIVGLLGPNGAGKSTCFSMLAGLLKADSGNILLNSKDITNLAMHLRSLSGLTYLPQEPSIFRELSTQDNLKALIESYLKIFLILKRLFLVLLQFLQDIFFHSFRKLF